MDLNEPILRTIKTYLGIQDFLTAFDTEIVLNISSAVFKLSQITPISGSLIINDETTWADLIGNNIENTYYETMAQYIYFNVRLAFDPPQNSFLVEAISSQISELTWRLTINDEEGE